LGLPLKRVESYPKARPGFIFTTMRKSPFPPVSVSLASDKKDVLFSFHTEEHEENYFYYAPTSELLSKKDQDYWLRHLETKTWFTQDVESAFRKLLDEIAI
jgi:hypothetical protein